MAAQVAILGRAEMGVQVARVGKGEAAAEVRAGLCG